MNTPVVPLDYAELLRRLERCTANIEHLAKEIAEERQRGREERDRISQRWQRFFEFVEKTNAQVLSLIKDVAEMKPEVDDYRDKKAEARGMIRVVALARVAYGVAGGTIAWLFLEAWKRHS